MDNPDQKDTFSLGNPSSWRLTFGNDDANRASINPIPSYYYTTNRGTDGEEGQQATVPFPELEGDIPEGPASPLPPVLPHSQSRQHLPSQQARRVLEREQQRQRQQPPRLNTTYLSPPPAPSHEPLSPPPLRIQKRASTAEGSPGQGMGLGKISPLGQQAGSGEMATTSANSIPSPSQANSPLGGTTTMSSQGRLPTTAQPAQRIASSGTPIVSKITLPLTPRAGRQSLSNGPPVAGTGIEQQGGDISELEPAGRTSSGMATMMRMSNLPSSPRPSVLPSPVAAYQPDVGGDKIERMIKRVDSGGGRIRTPTTANSTSQIPEYTFDEKSHPLTASPTKTNASWKEAAKYYNSPTGNATTGSGAENRYAGGRKSTSPVAAATRGNGARRKGSINENIWTNRNPLGSFGTAVRRDTDESVPATPLDQEVAQRQMLRSDSIASTAIAETDYEYPSTHRCSSRLDVHVPRASWLTISMIVLSVYSTAMSGLWFFTSLIQPHWGHAISSDKHHPGLEPSTASLLTTLFAKTIEMSFVSVFVGFLGQVLSRRAFIKDRAVTLAEISMKNWVVQPGSLLTQWQTLPYVGYTFLGVLSLLATISATLYTTASDAMVTPKLKFGEWHEMSMTGFVRSSYANPNFVRDNCQTPITLDLDKSGGPACLDVEYSGKSFHNLLAFMETWQGIHSNGTSKAESITQRPQGTAMLHENITVTSAWIEGEYSNVTAAFETFGRIVNNVSLAMPHPGLHAAATNPINGILQPQDLSGVGEYRIRASVVSPAVNVLCVNMDEADLAPLVYTEFPNARINSTNIANQVIGAIDWERDIPPPVNGEFLNRTVVDDIFRWGPQFGRRPPLWRMFPHDNNIITNTSVRGNTTLLADAIYILGKSNFTQTPGNYTLCELRSWLSTSCSTSFSISGTKGGELTAVCEKDNDENRYDVVNPGMKTPKPSGDWKNMVDQWRLAINLNGGISNSNTSNARILTRLAINQEPDLGQLSDNVRIAEQQGMEDVEPSGGLPALLPSMAEALAVLVSSTLMVGAMDTPFGAEDWSFNSHILGAPGHPETFAARIKSQEFVSGHTNTWQAIVFYPILLTLFLINALCLLYLATSLVGERGWLSTRLFARKFQFWRNDNGTTEPSNRGKDNRNSSSSSFYGTDAEAAGARNSRCPNNTMPTCDNAPGGLVTDYTEPANLFALAINSPPSQQLAGSCGAGPQGREFAVPFRVGYQEKANHYYFEEASDMPARRRWRGRGVEEEKKIAVGTGNSYRNLSLSKSWKL